MHIEFFKIDVIYILSILTGGFFIVCAIINPKKLILGNLTKSNFKDKKKYIYYKRILFLVIGLLMLAIILLYWLNVVDNWEVSITFLIPVLVIRIGELLISKKFLNKKQNKL